MLSSKNHTNTSNTRYLGLDYGDKTIGVALGCPDNRVATGLTTLTRDMEVALRPNINQLREIIREYGITHIVIGNPINMDGSTSVRAIKTQDFRDKLQRNFKSLKLTLWDERLSTQAVTRAFFSDSDMSKKQNKKQKETYRAHVDEMAAVYILQGFLTNNLEENMENETNMPHEHDEMDEIIIVTDDDGEEHQLHVLVSKEGENCTYLLAAVADDDDEETSVVLHLKGVMDSDAGPEDEMSLEVVDEEHEDFELVMKLFKDDYEVLEIIIDEEDPLLGT